MIDRKPLHEQIADVLRKEIRSQCEPGDRLDSESKQAKRFGVSIVTLREAMLRLSQEGLIERRHGSGTYVKESSKRKVAAVLLNEAYCRSQIHFFFLRLAQAVRGLLEKAEVHAEILLVPEVNGPTAIESLVEPYFERAAPGATRGVVAVAGLNSKDGLDRLESKGILTVSSSEHTHYVHSDHDAMVRAATRFLLDQGRTRLAFLQHQPYRAGVERDGFFLRPFIDELGRRGVPFHEEWVYGSVNTARPGNGWDRFRKLWETKEEKPDGVIVADDALFREVAPAILSLGVDVPKDLMVLTHANRDSDVFYPFPTVRMEYDPEDFAEALVDLLLARMEGRTVEQPERIIPFRWVGREEVGAGSAG